MTTTRKLVVAGVLTLVFFGIAGGIVYYKQRLMPRFVTVRSNALHRSGQPCGLGLQTLRAHGIQTIVNLRKPGGHGMEAEQAFAEKHGMSFQLIPIGYSHADMVKTTEAFLAIMDDDSNWPVLVHCSRGKERSGLLSAIFRMEYDRWSNQKALYEMYNLGMGPGAMPIVEQFVWDYVPRWKRDSEPAKLAREDLPEVIWQE